MAIVVWHRNTNRFKGIIVVWHIWLRTIESCHREDMPTTAEKWAQVSDEEEAAVIRDFEELKADDERIRNANARQLQPQPLFVANGRP